MKTKNRQLQNKYRRNEKRNEKLNVGNVHNMTLYGVYMSQMICYTQDCICIQTLLQRHRLLNIKVLSQGF
jgi:hypothetical protein